jgi:hypothetical protein
MATTPLGNFPLKKAFYKKKTFAGTTIFVILLISQISKFAGLSTFSMDKPLKVAEVSSGHSLYLS